MPELLNGGEMEKREEAHLLNQTNTSKRKIIVSASDESFAFKCPVLADRHGCFDSLTQADKLQETKNDKVPIWSVMTKKHFQRSRTHRDATLKGPGHDADAQKHDQAHA
ncbi:hypothetical protein Btru_002223 [Bulinus truncatus]|nr:hypothetical protein Btru_002223 [Bulinus truncatus]